MKAFPGHTGSTIRGIVGKGGLSRSTETWSRGCVRPFDVESVAVVGNNEVSSEVIISSRVSGSGIHLEILSGSVGFGNFGW